MNSLCSLDWLQTHGDPPASASQGHSTHCIGKCSTRMTLVSCVTFVWLLVTETQFKLVVLKRNWITHMTGKPNDTGYLGQDWIWGPKWCYQATLHLSLSDFQPLVSALESAWFYCQTGLSEQWTQPLSCSRMPWPLQIAGEKYLFSYGSGKNPRKWSDSSTGSYVCFIPLPGTGRSNSTRHCARHRELAMTNAYSVPAFRELTFYGRET